MVSLMWVIESLIADDVLRGIGRSCLPGAAHENVHGRFTEGQR
jgi:hypothetical protein